MEWNNNKMQESSIRQMERQRVESSIGSLHATSAIWTETESNSSISQIDETKDNLIQRLAKKLKNPAILAKIKPNYGSLGDFMHDVDITKDLLLHKKKKNDCLQENDQKKVRLAFKQRNLDSVIKSQESTPFQISIASKIMVEEMFEKNFKMSIQNFAAEHSNVHEESNNKINIETLEKMLSNMIEQPQQNHSRTSLGQGSDRNLKQFNLIKTNSLHSNENTRNNNFNIKEKYVLFQKIQQKYRTLQKITLDSEVIKSETKVKLDPLFQIKNDILTFKKIDLSFLQLIEVLKDIQLFKIKELKLIAVKLTDDIVCFLLDVFTVTGKALKSLHFEQIKIQNTQKLANHIQLLIQKCPIHTLRLNKMAIKTKDFCLIALGIGAKKQFTLLQLLHNNICEVGKKCYDILEKFFKNIVIDLKGNPIQKLNSPQYKK